MDKQHLCGRLYLVCLSRSHVQHGLDQISAVPCGTDAHNRVSQHIIGKVSRFDYISLLGSWVNNYLMSL